MKCSLVLFFFEKGTPVRYIPIPCFLAILLDFGGDFSKCGYVTRYVEKQSSDLLTDEQTDADLSKAQQKFRHLKGLVNDVRLNPTNPKGVTDQ